MGPGMRRAVRVASGVGFFSLLIAGAASLAFVPEAERIARAMATANEAAERTDALQLDLTLRVADREPIGTGKLVTHPTGLARLELRDAAGRVERHLRVVREHAASRNGREIERPRSFLPPLSFLQIDSSETLRQALLEYGLDPEAAAIEPCGETICYVLGDPSRVAPPPPPEEGAEEGEQDSGEPDHGRGITILEPEEDETGIQRPTGPGLWVDSRTFEIVRIDAPAGVTVEFGPGVDFKGVRFPDWIRIQEPEREPVRFDILGVVPVNAPAAGFSRTWLLTPPQTDQSEPPSAPAGR